MRVLFRCRLRPCSEPCAPGIRCADSGIQILRSPEPGARSPEPGARSPVLGTGVFTISPTPPGGTPPDVADSNRSEGVHPPLLSERTFLQRPWGKTLTVPRGDCRPGAEDSRLETGNGY
jgi:hypothetical protein